MFNKLTQPVLTWVSAFGRIPQRGPRFLSNALVSCALLAFSARLLPAQCPAVANDTTCGTVITITDSGSSISATGQGPYGVSTPGSDYQPYDTLVGVINNSSLPLNAIGLSSTLPIFGFYNDGIDNYGVPGNNADNTGYGGPNAYFTNIDSTQSNGIVNFITPIPPGGTGYFSLAAALSFTTACSDLIDYAMAPPILGGTNIATTFTPNNGYTLAAAAQVCGFTNFNWQQTITNLPAPSPYFATNFHNLTAPAPFNDPPPGGYTYQYPHLNAVALPIYYNLTGNPANLSLAGNQSATTLNFYDAPADDCLPGGPGISCGGTAPPGSYLAFSTHLVGIIGTFPNAVVQDTGIGFTWTDTFNGTSLGISVLNSTHPVDPGSGTGGIILTGVNQVSSYQFPKNLTLKTINGKPAGKSPQLTLLTGAQISSVVSPFLYIPQTKTYDGLVLLRNASDKTIQGPLQLVLLSLTNGVTLKNPTGIFGSAPYLTIRGVSDLAPGECRFVLVQFNGPASAKIKFSPAVYTGGFN